MRLEEKFWMTKGYLTRASTIFLLTILMLSLSAISIAPQNTQATILSDLTDLCESVRIGCDDQTPSSPSDDGGSSPEPSPSRKLFLATFLQYVNKDSQVGIYKPNMDTGDSTRLRATNGDMKSDYVKASLSLPGPAGVSFISSKEVIDNAKRVKDLGFTFIEFNLEPGLSPDSDNNDVVGAMKRAAQAAHQQGLEFLAAPSRGYTTTYGAQIAPFTDIYHIQAQSLQERGVKAYSDYVHSMVPTLKKANSDLDITVQVSTKRSNAPGLSLLDTLKKCTDSVMDVVDGVSVWYGNPDLQILKSYVEWYNNKY
jgi:hypothetical protein